MFAKVNAVRMMVNGENRIRGNVSNEQVEKNT